jgi:hypothetical protein
MIKPVSLLELSVQEKYRALDPCVVPNGTDRLVGGVGITVIRIGPGSSGLMVKALLLTGMPIRSRNTNRAMICFLMMLAFFPLNQIFNS